MAATRLIALHVNKGKTVAQCLADRTDYSQNAAKTNDGEFISSYAVSYTHLESERPSVLADLKSKAEHIPPAKYSETREEVL